MRVVVNQLAATGRKTGIGHYTLQLLRCLREQAGEDRIDAFPDGRLRGLPDLLSRCRSRIDPGDTGRQPQPESQRRPLAGFRREALRLLRRVNRSVWSRLFRAACDRGDYDVYHEPNFIPFASDRPTVATVHDLSVLKHPEWHPADRVAHFERYFRRGLARCTHFLAISEFGRQEMINSLGVPAERVTVTYMGIRPGLAPRPEEEVAARLRRLGLPPRYLLYLGTIEPRKNVLMLLRAYCSLPAGLRERWPLLLVGGWGWNARPVAEFLDGEATGRGVIRLGYLAEEHLAAVYSGARALLYPSYYEGFGLPPVEMMACGGAVLASTAGALVETVGSRAHLIDPEDTDGWREAMTRVITDDDWWRALRRDVTTLARPFTWDRCAADTLRVYRLLAGAPSVENAPVVAELPPVRRRAG